MPPPDVQHELTEVISEMLARNRFYFGPSGPGYFGLEVTCLSPDGSEFDLALTFKSGVRYCCIEWGCHIGLYSSEWFRAVRERLAARGITELPPMTVRKLHVLVEKGAVSDGPGNTPRPHENSLEYDEGPFSEVGPALGQPVGS